MVMSMIYPNKLFSHALARIKFEIFKAAYKIRCPKPDFITEKYWDYLIVLDACRFDAFKNINYISGRLSKIISAGCNTRWWLTNTFNNYDMKKTIYISANPYGSYLMFRKFLGRIPFYKIVEVWKDKWDEKLNTVHPEAINKAVLKCIKKYPSKRLLIHYIQPHHPFIGDVKIQEFGALARDVVLGYKKHKNKTVWDLAIDGKVNLDLIKRAYISNLKFVLKYVDKLLSNLKGKKCILQIMGIHLEDLIYTTAILILLSQK